MFLGHLVGHELRDYQRKLIDDILTAFGSYTRVMAQLPTGGGKTVIFAYIAGLYASQGQRVLVLAHREELINQAWQKLSDLTPYPVGIIKAGIKPDLTCPIQVASVQTMVNRLEAYAPFDLIIVDEAHHAPCDTYQRILGHYPMAQVLGMTATVWRMDGKGFEDLFDHLCLGPSTMELIKKGYLSTADLGLMSPLG
jgi:superfamily II DNA or RNA helicase